MNAGDIVYSFSRIIDKNTASSGAWIFNNKLDPSKGFEAIDRHYFPPAPPQALQSHPRLLSMQYCSIVRMK